MSTPQIPAKVQRAIDIIESTDNTATVERTHHGSFNLWAVQWESDEQHPFLRTSGQILFTEKLWGARRTVSMGRGHLITSSAHLIKIKTWSDLRIKIEVYTTTPKGDIVTPG